VLSCSLTDIKDVNGLMENFNFVLWCFGGHQNPCWRLYSCHYRLHFLPICKTHCRRGNLLVSSAQAYMPTVSYLHFFLTPKYLGVRCMSYSKCWKSSPCPPGILQQGWM
jgi:hypothetical protein